MAFQLQNFDLDPCAIVTLPFPSYMYSFLNIICIPLQEVQSVMAPVSAFQQFLMSVSVTFWLNVKET